MFISRGPNEGDIARRVAIGDLSALEMNRGRILSTPNRVVNWLYLAKGIRTRNAWRPHKLKAQHGPRTVSLHE
jgi:hypothetical protein